MFAEDATIFKTMEQAGPVLLAQAKKQEETARFLRAGRN
jgi:hypothetical protein